MKLFTLAKVSPSGMVNKEDLKRWGRNLLIFVAPTLSIFFGQLALGVDWRLALPVALLAFWQALADFFKKLKAGK